jgi:RNase P subunit RPR2
MKLHKVWCEDCKEWFWEDDVVQRPSNIPVNGKLLFMCPQCRKYKRYKPVKWQTINQDQKETKKS